MGIFNTLKNFGKFIGEAAESFSKSGVFKVLYSGVCLATLPLGVAALACGGVVYAGAYIGKTLDATVIKHFGGSTIVNDTDWTATLDWIGSFNKQYLWEGYLGYPFIKASNLYQKEADKWLEKSGRGNSKDVGNDAFYNVLTGQSPEAQIAHLKKDILKAENSVKERLPLLRADEIKPNTQKNSTSAIIDSTNTKPNSNTGAPIKAEQISPRMQTNPLLNQPH
jgi:hypothetical protein